MLSVQNVSDILRTDLLNKKATRDCLSLKKYFLLMPKRIFQDLKV